MKKLLSLSLVPVLLLVCASSVLAEPNAAVSHLARQQVTLWDWGMDRLEFYMDRKLKAKAMTLRPQGYARLLYDKEKSKIILVIGGGTIVKKEEDAKTVCGNYIKIAKALMNVDHSSGKPVVDAKDRSVANKFFANRAPIVSPKRPADLSEQIDKMISIRANSGWGESAEKSKMVSCSSDLLSTEIQFGPESK